MSAVLGSVEAIAALATAGSFVIGVLGWMVRKAWRGGKRLSRVIDDYLGTPARPGVPAQPGVMERLASQDRVLAEVKTGLAEVQAELPKNGVPLAQKIDALWTKHIREEAAAAIVAAMPPAQPAQPAVQD